MDTKTQDRDGFVILDRDDNEVDFIACDHGGSMRERVEMGLLMKVDIERYHFRDTRDDA